ncbi:MAG: metallophosphoesterase family protein [bacterium]|nr:metallophosphoesterase family protein [bacterium]
MRIALISDIHGNEIALKKVLGDIKLAGADSIVCLGDIATLGPNPASVLEVIRDLGCACIMGNHDDFLANPDSGLVEEYVKSPFILEQINWCRSKLSTEDLDFLGTFKESMMISPDELSSIQSSILFFHGSPRSHMEDILATTDTETLDEMLDGKSAAVMAGGHTHIRMLRRHRELLIVNPGSVGFPFKEYTGGLPPVIMNWAEYAFIEFKNGVVDINLRRIPLDKNELYKAAEASTNPLRPMLMQQYS